MSTLQSLVADTLRFFGGLTPNVPKVRAFGNRILWPIHRVLRLGGGVVDTMGVKMRLDPSECVDRNLWFTPHLYDQQEIRFALNDAESRGVEPYVFIDVGANVGYWTLRLANGRPNVVAIAVEANPRTADILEENVHLNHLKNVSIVRSGLAEKSGALVLYCGKHGNRGGDSFVIRHKNAEEIVVPVVTLLDVCLSNKVDKVDFIKLDIEGLELSVLQSFFREAPSKLLPRNICLETSHNRSLGDLMTMNGYEMLLACRENAIFRLARD
jgi:FkbM family methyltransferase